MQEVSITENAQKVNSPVSVTKRYEEFDYMKGILIILTVLGHVNTPLTAWIYSFHMPVFFAISGYFWNKKHSVDIKSAKKYVISRVKRLYIPFIVINILFILLNNIFLKISFLTNDPYFLELTADYSLAQTLSEHMSLMSMAKGIIKALLFSGGCAKLCGVTWFLSSLFFVSVTHIIIEIIMKRIFGSRCDDTRVRISIIVFVMLVCLSSSFVLYSYCISVPGIIRRILPCYAAYICGMLIKESHLVESINYFISLACFGVICLFSFLPLDTSVELSRGRTGNPICFIILCICGFVFCFGFSKVLSKCRVVLIKICGTESMYIMLLHCISFKLVSWIYIGMTQKSILFLASYPALENEAWFLPIIYVIVGISLPLILRKFYNKLKSNIILSEKAVRK